MKKHATTNAHPQPIEALEQRFVLSATFVHSGINSTEIAQIGDTIYFAGASNYGGDRRATGTELWKTDGTVSGTRLVKNIATGDFDSRVRLLTVVGGELYFAFYNYTKQRDQLWRSDGTDQGTEAIFTAPKTYVNVISELTPVGDKLFFLVGSPVVRGVDELLVNTLYATQTGQSGVTQLAPNVFDGRAHYSPYGGTSDPEYTIWNARYPTDLTEFGGRVYFAVWDIPNQYSARGVAELYQSDGTDAGTKRIFTFDSQGKLLGILPTADKLFLALDRAANESPELWESAGTSSSTRVVGALSETSPSYPLAWYTSAIDDRLLFQDASGDLFSTSGGDQQPTPLTTSYRDDFNYSVFKGDFVYYVRNVQNGKELWRSDGTQSGTALQNSLGSDYKNVHLIGIVGNAFYYLAKPKGKADLVVLTTDGATGAVRRAYIPLPVDDVQFVSIKGKTYYVAEDSIGDTLYRLDPGLDSVSGKVVLNSTGGKLLLIGYRVYVDTNDNGIFDSGEPSTVSSRKGTYYLSALPAGSLSVRIEKLSSRQQMTGPDVESLRLAPDASATVNFGFTSDPRNAGIRGTVFDDSNGDGRRATGETGAKNVTVYADLNDNQLFDTGEPSVQTAADGSYDLEGLPAGSIHVDFIVPDKTSRTYVEFPLSAVLAPPGQSVVGPDFSFIRNATVRGFVFGDTNGDGVRGPGEVPLARVRVHVQLAQNGFEDIYVPFQATVRTHSNGRYEVSVPAHVTAADLHIAPDLKGLRASVGAVDPLEVSHSSGVICACATIGSSTVSPGLGEGQNIVRDYGLTDRVLIHGKVFHDDDANGEPGYAERGISGRLIYIDLNGDGVLGDQEPFAYTNSKGKYSFGTLAPGTYIVRAALPRTAWIATTPTSKKFKLGYGETGLANFGNQHR
jgi:ELWxxDGT repeat protein